MISFSLFFTSQASSKDAKTIDLHQHKRYFAVIYWPLIPCDYWLIRVFHHSSYQHVVADRKKDVKEPPESSVNKRNARKKKNRNVCVVSVFWTRSKCFRSAPDLGTYAWHLCFFCQGLHQISIYTKLVRYNYPNDKVNVWFTLASRPLT